MKENALDIINKIEESGYLAYIVGGMVRDYVMKRDSYDVDICTSATPKDLIKIFDDAILPKEKYGAVTLKYKDVRYEITTFRKELKYVKRRPVEIAYTNSFYEDMKRRDFTINSMVMNKDGQIIDIFDGKKDIDNKIIRCVGNAKDKFTEDPLRMLRAIRFATVFNFKLESTLQSAIKECSYLLKDISYFRKKDELNKIFANTNAKYGIKLMCSLNMDKYLELNNLKKIKITNDILGMYSQLDVINKYPFSKLEKSTITSVNQIVLTGKIDSYTIYKFGLYITSIAGEILGVNKKYLVKLDKSLQIRAKKEIDVTVDDICKSLNMDKGPWLKEVYSDIEYKISMNKLKNNNKDILEYIIKKYKKHTI